MKIKIFSIFKVALGLKRPYTIAFKTVSDVENVIVSIELENGVVGYGSGNPSKEVTGESIADTQSSLSDFKDRGLFEGQDINQLFALLKVVQKHFQGRPAAMAAIDIALHDAFCKNLKIPVVSFYGRQMDGLYTSVTIGIKDVNDTLQEAKEYLGLGFKILKVKLGHNIEVDIERLSKLREQFGYGILIRVDANQGYDAQQTHSFLNDTEHLDLELIEQPVKVQTFPILDLPAPYLHKIAADESLQTETDAFQLSTHSIGCSIFNIKLMKCGGVAKAMEIANLARFRNTRLMWGCNDESIISISAALHAAYANEHTHYIDLDGSFDLITDVATGGFILKDGKMFIAEGYGFGFEKI